jgi:hypothetical protein
MVLFGCELVRRLHSSGLTEAHGLAWFSRRENVHGSKCPCPTKKPTARSMTKSETIINKLQGYQYYAHEHSHGSESSFTCLANQGVKNIPVFPPSTQATPATCRIFQNQSDFHLKHSAFLNSCYFVHLEHALYFVRPNRYNTKILYCTEITRSQHRYDSSKDKAKETSK